VWRPDGKRPFGRPGNRWGIILKWVFKKFGREAWTGMLWVRTGTGSGRLWAQ